MDMNYTYYRQQVSQFMADTASSLEARYAHQSLADAYRVRMDDAKKSETPQA